MTIASVTTTRIVAKVSKNSSGIISSATPITLKNQVGEVHLPLATISGGTGRSSFANGQILVGNTTGGLDTLTLGAAGTVLQSNGSALIYDSIDAGVF